MISPVSVVIEVSEANESPALVLMQIAKTCGPQLVSDVHIVQWAYRSDNPQWVEGMNALREAGIGCELHTKLDVSKLRSKALVRMEPDLYLTDGALKMLIAQMANATESWHLPLAGADHFAISSNVVIVPPEGKLRLTYWIEAALAYGWLLVLFAFDTLRYYLNAGAYHRNVDMTARLVSVTYPNRTVLAPHRWWTWWLGTGMAIPHSGGEACVLIPSQRPLAFLFRLIRTHRALGLALCWPLLFTLYYCLFSFPWWTLILPRYYIPFWWMVQSIDPRQWPWWWQTLQLGHLFLIALVSYNQLTIPWGLQPLHILLYPLYLASFPLIYCYGRFARAQTAHAAIAAYHQNVVKSTTTTPNEEAK